MKQEIILKPAKRVLVLYLLAFFVTISVLALSLLHFSRVIPLEPRFLVYLWEIIALLGGGLLCYAALWHLTCSYRLTHECVTGSTGILSRQDIRIALNQVVDYRIMRPLIERLIGLGDLHIDTAGQDTDKLIMYQIGELELAKAVSLLDELLNRDQHKTEKAVNAVLSA